MKKILSILLIAVLLTACGKSDPVEETIVKLPDGSYIYQDEHKQILCGEGYRISNGSIQQLIKHEEKLDLNR